MRTNCITDSTKIMLLAGSTIITCVLVALGLTAMRTAKNLNEAAILQMAELNQGLKDRDIKMFDAMEVYGSEVVNFMRKHLGDYDAGEIAPIYVIIKTSTKEKTYQNGSEIKNLQNFTNENYIKPTALFYGEVIQNENDVILGIKFTQKS
ncbi:MAG: hypothetical protein GX306_06100 [Clostridiales bacterium]|jgi:hypothetical protein|nr:hypothetical protein [Clostridiales bacterium]